MKANNISTISDKEYVVTNFENSLKTKSKATIEKDKKKTYYIIILSLLLAIFALLFVIRYPTKAIHNISLTTTQPPQYIVANATGNITPLVTNSINVEKNEPFAIIENKAKYEHILQLQYELNAFKRLYKSNQLASFHFNLPHEPQLDEILPYYQAFQDSLQQLLILIEEEEEIAKQDTINLQAIAKEQIAAHKNILKRLDKKIMPLKRTQDTSVLLYQECYTNLYPKGIVNYNDLFKQRQTIVNQHIKIGRLQKNITQNANFLSYLDDYEDISNASSLDYNISLMIEKSYNELVNQIRKWEKKYVLKAPTTGKLQYLRFNPKQMKAQKDATIASIISPDNATIFGEMKLSQREAKKMNIGDKVSIELAKYPAKQFGYIDGELMSITNMEEQKYAEIFVWLPNDLTTSDDSLLHYQKNLYGKATVNTNDNSLFRYIFGL